MSVMLKPHHVGWSDQTVCVVSFHSGEKERVIVQNILATDETHGGSLRREMGWNWLVTVTNSICLVKAGYKWKQSYSQRHGSVSSPSFFTVYSPVIVSGIIVCMHLIFLCLSRCNVSQVFCTICFMTKQRVHPKPVYSVQGPGIKQS